MEEIEYFIVERLDGKHRIVGCAPDRARAQNGVAAMDPAGRRDLRILGLDEWVEG